MILYRLLVLVAFWPEVRIHSGISRSSHDVQKLVPEIAEQVMDRVLLSIEQQRYSIIFPSLPQPNKPSVYRILFDMGEWECFDVGTVHPVLLSCLNFCWEKQIFAL